MEQETRGYGQNHAVPPCTQYQKGDTMNQSCPPESVSILHELDLGQHTLLIMNNGSIDLLAHEEQAAYLTDNAMSLDSEETYRLFASLHEYFKQGMQ